MPGPGPDIVRALTCLIQDSDLVFGDKLGSGSFGVVKKAEWHTPTGRVVGLLVVTTYPYPTFTFTAECTLHAGTLLLVGMCRDNCCCGNIF